MLCVSHTSEYRFNRIPTLLRVPTVYISLLKFQHQSSHPENKHISTLKKLESLYYKLDFNINKFRNKMWPLLYGSNGSSYSPSHVQLALSFYIIKAIEKSCQGVLSEIGLPIEYYVNIYTIYIIYCIEFDYIVYNFIFLYGIRYIKYYTYIIHL